MKRNHGNPLIPKITVQTILPGEHNSADPRRKVRTITNKYLYSGFDDNDIHDIPIMNVNFYHIDHVSDKEMAGQKKR